jgi:hypothetical protein
MRKSCPRARSVIPMSTTPFFESEHPQKPQQQELRTSGEEEEEEEEEEDVDDDNYDGQEVGGGEK